MRLSQSNGTCNPLCYTLAALQYQVPTVHAMAHQAHAPDRACTKRSYTAGDLLLAKAARSATLVVTILQIRSGFWVETSGQKVESGVCSVQHVAA